MKNRLTTSDSLPKCNPINRCSITQAIDKKLFSADVAIGLTYLLNAAPVLRKDAEKACVAIPYLPSFIQKVNPKLETYCGCKIESYYLTDKRAVYLFKVVDHD
jgi:hypothetical protein